MYTDLNLLFNDKVITLRNLFASLHSPFTKNNHSEFEAVESQYELLKAEVQELLKAYPFLQDQPMAERIPQ